MKIYLSKSFRTVLDSGFRILCQWNLDSGFLELYPGFQKPRILDSTSKNSPDSGIRISYMWRDDDKQTSINASLI